MSAPTTRILTFEPPATAAVAANGIASAAPASWQDTFARGTLSGGELEALIIPTRERLLADWFCAGDLGFLFAKRGVGKTWLSLLLANAVASGGAAGPWQASAALPVLYVDGEMPLELMQLRARAVGETSGQITYLNHEQLFEQTERVLNLTLPECQEGITALCLSSRTRLLVLDNLSCLFSGVSENDADAWEAVLPWLLTLRRHKIAVLFVCHAGRNSQMRGTSRREDAAAWVIRLDDALDSAGGKQGARFVSTFTKPSRNTPAGPPPLEWAINTDAASGRATVAFAEAQGADVVLGWVANGLTTCGEIAEEMNLSKGQVSKLATKLIEAGKLKKEGRGYALPLLGEDKEDDDA